MRAARPRERCQREKDFRRRHRCAGGKRKPPSLILRSRCALAFDAIKPIKRRSRLCRAGFMPASVNDKRAFPCRRGPRRGDTERHKIRTDSASSVGVASDAHPPSLHFGTASRDASSSSRVPGPLTRMTASFPRVTSVRAASKRNIPARFGEEAIACWKKKRTIVKYFLCFCLQKHKSRREADTRSYPKKDVFVCALFCLSLSLNPSSLLPFFLAVLRKRRSTKRGQRQSNH